MGLFNPKSREEQARYVCCENARFREDLRENKEKTEQLENPTRLRFFGLRAMMVIATCSQTRLKLAASTTPTDCYIFF